ncbi:hypothetical protein RAA17_04445 [Komagataeibacter rhaeticus]|nr:hypothetical protein [Komagataeibacter rhaeticus]
MADLGAVMTLADRLHPACPERMDVLAERHRLCPEGCLIMPDAQGAAGDTSSAIPGAWARHRRWIPIWATCPNGLTAGTCMTSPSFPPCAGAGPRRPHYKS